MSLRGTKQSRSIIPYFLEEAYFNLDRHATLAMTVLFVLQEHFLEDRVITLRHFDTNSPTLEGSYEPYSRVFRIFFCRIQEESISKELVCFIEGVHTACKLHIQQDIIICIIESIDSYFLFLVGVGVI